MQSFKSVLSGQTFLGNEKVAVNAIRTCIVDEIKKDFPDFPTKGFVSINELNIYRQRYIQNVLESNIGTLTDIEQKVAQHINDNEFISDHLIEDKNDIRTFGQRVADKVASFGGSWTFIISFGVFLIVWILVNVFFLSSKAFDPYPFILLNLILSCIAALQAPIIMMSQNRQEEKDRERAKNDYMVNLKSEIEIRMLHEKIDHLIINQQEKLMEVQQVQIDMLTDILQQTKK